MGEVAKPERDKPTHRNDRQNAGIHQFDLLVCWLFLIAIHAFIFPWVIRLCFLWDSPIPAWGITGAVGSFAVCLALSTRPLATRLMMGAITLFSVRASTGYVLSHLFNSQHSLARRSYLPPLRMNQFLLNFMDDTAAQSAAILIGWLFGALVAGYCFTWSPDFEFHRRVLQPIEKFFPFETFSSRHVSPQLSVSSSTSSCSTSNCFTCRRESVLGSLPRRSPSPSFAWIGDVAGYLSPSPCLGW